MEAIRSALQHISRVNDLFSALKDIMEMLVGSMVFNHDCDCGWSFPDAHKFPRRTQKLMLRTDIGYL
jgi:hypothetical protein